MEKTSVLGALLHKIPIFKPNSSHLPSSTKCITTVCFHRRPHPTVTRPPLVDSDEYYQSKASNFWNKFYKCHQNKFFKDRHYLEKDWGQYFCDEDDACSSNGKVVLEVGCGAGNTIFPLLASYPKLYIHACDFSTQAIELVKSRVRSGEDRLNAFVCNVIKDDLLEHIAPSSVDIVTMIFTLSAVSPKNMPLILQNIKQVLKPTGYVLFRDYATGDYAQVSLVPMTQADKSVLLLTCTMGRYLIKIALAELHARNQMISNDYCVRGDGTISFFYSEDFLSSLFLGAGFNTIDINTYCKKIKNHRLKVVMDRRWIRAVFSLHDRNISEPR